MSSGNPENSGGDMTALSVNPNSDGLSAQTEPKAEEHTRGPDSSNGVFVPNESGSSAVSSSESPAGSALIAQPLRVDSNSSSSTSHDASDGSLRTILDHHSAVDPSSDEEDNLESSLLLNEAADGEYESGKIETAEACAARDRHTDSDPVSSSGRVRRSSNLEHAPGLQQDVLPDGDMSVGQNGSSACGGDGNDSTVDQSVSDLSTQSNKWERLGARPRDRPQTIFPVEPSLAGSVAHGVTSSVFLARHSQDESLNQGSAEQVLPDDTSSQGASYVDEPNKAMPYFGGCQVASRPDAHSRSLFPFLSLTGGGYDRRNAEGGNAYNEQFNANNGLVPGASSSYFRGNNFLVNGTFPSSSTFDASNCDSFRTDFALDTSRSTGMKQFDRIPYIPLDGQIESGRHTSFPRNQRPHSGMTGSHLVNGSLIGAAAEPQLTPPIYGAQIYSGLNGNTLAIASEHEKTQTAWKTSSGLSASTRNMARVDIGSLGLPLPYSVARSNGADSGLVRVEESASTSQYAPVSASNSTLNTAGDRVVAAANREGNLDPPHIDAAFPSGNSRVSRLVAGANTEPHGAEASLPSANSGGSMLNRDVGTGTVESTDNSLLALEQRVEEACAMVERVLRAREERELFGREIEKKEREVRERRARKRREREARELEEPRRWPQQQEAITGRGSPPWRCEHYRMQFLTAESLESRPSSDAEFCRGVAKARAKMLEREGAARSIEDANRRWCTCEEESEEDLNPICRRCCKHRYLGPACLSRHDNCSCYLQIGEDSGKCRSCGGNVSAGVSRLVAGANTEPHGAEPSLPSANSGGSMLNRDVGTGTVESTDNSLLALEQCVEEACAMVEKVLREREERELFGREIKKKEREIRELRARKRREREARELEEARRWPQQQEAITGRGRLQIGEDSGKCRSCGGNMSAYFCSICKHFTSVDKNPYHCEKCGICRIHEDKSFHCDVCNVCLDKRLEGKHKCRPDSGHDKCCICLEDAFSGCQILPCSHKVHRECAIAMIQNGIRTCPVCRHPFYIPASE